MIPLLLKEIMMKRITAFGLLGLLALSPPALAAAPWEQAVATAMRIEEITRIRWNDIDERKRTVIVRDRKDPRHKDGNHQPVPLLAATVVWPPATVSQLV